MDVAGKVFVVTGGGNGIGREVVLGLLRRGARVAAVDLSEDGLRETELLADAPTGSLTTHAVSVADRDAVAALPDAVVAAHGQVDGVVNVAGIIQPFVPFNELDFAQIERVMDVNFQGVVSMCKAFLPLLLERPSAALVNVSSMGALVPVPGQSAYGASKAAVKLLTEGLYAELRGTNVAVTLVIPGGVGTDIASNSGASIPGQTATADDAPMKLTSPADAGRQIVDAIDDGRFRVRIGGDARMLDRLSRLMPRRATEIVAKRMESLLS